MRAAFFLEVLEAAAREKAAAATTFARFITARDAAAAQAAYDELRGLLGFAAAEGGDGGGGGGSGGGAVRATLAVISPLLLPVLPHRARQLLVLLSKRASQPQYFPNAAGVRAVIVGAGPVGLRTAIELAMLGVEVTMLEGRERFSRLQVLHIWEWVERDLIELGVKLLDPSIFAAADLRRCGTSQLQHSLFKVALLLGVRVRFGCAVDSLDALRACHQEPVDVLVDASGARCRLLESLGFERTLALRSARALCIVISLANGRCATRSRRTQ